MLLEHWDLLDIPMLYLSLHSKRHRAEYHRRLGIVRTEGAFESWLEYFLVGDAVIADEAVTATQQLFALINTDWKKVLAGHSPSAVSMRPVEELPAHPIVTVAGMVKLLKTTKPTAAKAASGIVEAGGSLSKPLAIAGDRAYSYEAYLNLPCTGTELEWKMRGASKLAT